MNLLRTTAAVLTALAALTLTAAPALAHAGLTDSSPADGVTLDTVPSEVVLEFSEEVRTPAFAVVTGPDGRSHEAGEPSLDGPTVTQPLDAARAEGIDPNGSWTVAYRVVSADGHPIQGQTTFTVNGAPVPDASASTSASATPSADGPTEGSADGSAEGGNAKDSNESGSSSPAPLIIAITAALLCAVVAIQQNRKVRAKNNRAQEIPAQENPAQQNEQP